MPEPTEPCVFCDIVAGTISAAIVWEGHDVLAFMDNRQAHPGHTLVIPKAHVPNIYELPDELAGGFMQTVSRVARAVRDAYQPDGISLWQSNGPGAGQEVPHLHFHIHPRWTDDTVLKVYAVKPDKPGLDVLNEHANLIRSHLENS